MGGLAALLRRAGGWRAILPLVVLAALAIWVERAAIRDILRAAHTIGFDLDVVCAALGPILRGLDPYAVQNLVARQSAFSYPYLPHVALLAAPLCAAPSPAGYGAAYLVLLTGSVAAMARGLGGRWLEAVLLGLIAPAVFDVSRWLVLTGNVAALEVPFAALMVVAVRRGAYPLAGALLGVVASFKLLPIVGLLAFLLVLPPRDALRAMAAGCASLLAIVAANMLAMGWTGLGFFRQLVGAVPGQHSTFGESGSALAEAGLGWLDPNLFDFAFTLARTLGLAHRTLPITALALGALLLGAGLVALRGMALREPWCRTRLFCLAVLCLNLMLFRLKPYAFAALVPLALACCLTREGRVNIALALAAAVPAIAILNARPAIAVLPYYQLMSLMLMIAAILLALALEAFARRGKGDAERLVAAAQ